MAAIPKPASTVILVDGSSNVYMTRRPETMRFLGGYYVFPGGAVEPADHDIAPVPELEGESFCFSHYIAAARELFEEVGIFLGGRKDGSPFHLGNEETLAYRQSIINGNVTFSYMLKEEGLRLNLALLRYFGHFITPEVSPIRFDTRFFLAALPEGQIPQPDEREIADAFWISPSAALDALQTGEMPMVAPTILSLASLGNPSGNEQPMLQDGKAFIRKAGIRLFPDETVS